MMNRSPAREVKKFCDQQRKLPVTFFSRGKRCFSTGVRTSGLRRTRLVLQQGYSQTE